MRREYHCAPTWVLPFPVLASDYGTHEELVGSGPVHKRLFETQLLA